MQNLKLGFFSLGFFIGGWWLVDLIGNPDISDTKALLGRILAIVMGFFCCGAVHAIWGKDADDADFEARMRRDIKKGRFKPRA